MRKTISTLVLAGAALLASCGKEEMTNVVEQPGMQPVTLSVSLDKGVQTRATNKASDEEVTRCLVQVLDSERNPIEGYTTAQEMTGNEESGYTRTVILDAEKSYTLLFWADRGAECYSADDLKSVSKAADADPAKAIAYAAKVVWTKNSGRSIAAELKHAVTKLTVRTTAAIPGGTLYIKIPQTYPAYNVQAGESNGKPAGDAAELSCTATYEAAAANANVCSIYALVGTEPQSVTLASGSGEGTEVSNVPLAPNVHVILKGDVEEIGGNRRVEMKATIDPEWSKTEEATFESAPMVGDYFYANGTWSTNYKNDPGNPCIGVVFAVNDDGKSGKIVSLDETTAAWQPDYTTGGTAGTDSVDDGEKNMNTVQQKLSPKFSSFPAFRFCYEKTDGGLKWYLPAPHELQELYAASCGLKLVVTDPQEGEAVRWDVINNSAMFEDNDKYTAQRNNFKNRIEAAGGADLGDYLSSYESTSHNEKVVQIDCGINGGGTGAETLKTSEHKVRAIAKFTKK